MSVTRMLLTAAVAVAGCSSGGTPAGAVASAAPTPGEVAPSSPVEPMTVAGAQAAAKDGYDAYAAGDYGGWWDVWTPAAQQVISRAEYLRLSGLCKPGAVGTPFNIQKVTVTGDTAKVRWERLGLLVQLDTWTYVHGVWRHQPGPDLIADYKLGADKAAARRRAEPGFCN
jgi:hypothetical protein